MEVPFNMGSINIFLKIFSMHFYMVIVHQALSLAPYEVNKWGGMIGFVIK
jgi:hypothetical protein